MCLPNFCFRKLFIVTLLIARKKSREGPLDSPRKTTLGTLGNAASGKSLGLNSAHPRLYAEWWVSKSKERLTEAAKGKTGR